MPDTLKSSLQALLGLPALRRVPRSVLVAVSGGADSVALLRAAAALGPQLGWQVEALHCDHGLRAAAKADARFVDDLCGRLGLTLYAYQGKLKKGPGMEERARAWRHQCYAHGAARSGSRLILLAHHAGDQAETLLMNLVRGTGLHGAAGMQVLSPLPGRTQIQLGRPFLGLMPQELRASLKRLRQPWREDGSNRDTTLARNHVRQVVLPALLKLNPKAIEHLAAFSSRIKRDEPGLAELLGLDAKARQRVAALKEAGKGQADLSRGWTLSRGGLALQKAWSIELKPGTPTARKLNETNAFWFSDGILKAGFKLRGAKVGERMRPFGFGGSRLIRDLLAEAKVPVDQRAAWPVLEVEGVIVAVLGLRRGQGWEAQPGKPGWRLSWKRPI
jgi:tRNA(Ile)-lysidine synthetase-like protein